MKCLNCAFINPEDARFCQNCGHPLERACPVCGTPNTPEARFCKSCGSALQSLARVDPALTREPSGEQDLRHARLAAAAPTGLLEKARASAHLAGERRVVTALFADVVGSTGLAEQMDPEDWTTIMNRAFDILTPVIYRYEGTIARLMGDALLVFFGAPVAHEDDPIRAAKAALDLIEATRSYAAELRSTYGIDFALRVGMNTGQVVVGEVGSNLVYEYTAMGDAVNLAARMQSTAQPMTVLLTQNTQRFLRGLFELEDVGEIEVKGKVERVHAYALKKAYPQPVHSRSLAGLSSPLVGRQKELETLLGLSQAVKAGLGRAVLITGEPGIGKSRLIDEWKKSAIGFTWVEGHCLSYGQGLAYHLMADLVRSAIYAVTPGDLEIGEALSATCAALLGETGPLTIYPYLAHLLSVPLEREALERLRTLDPQALQGQYLASIRTLLSRISARQSTILVVEDIHWADAASVDLLVRMLPLVFEAPILVSLVTRVDREAPGWKLVTGVREQMGGSLSEIDLAALSEAESQELVSNLLDSIHLPEKTQRLILSKTEGNPLFVEEVVRMLIDRGILSREERGWVLSREIETVEIPDNLQSLLLARIDRLPDDAKQVLRVAAVIGRQFSVRVLEQVLKRQEQIQPG